MRRDDREPNQPIPGRAAPLPDRLPEADARRVLARASERDAAWDAARDAAREAVWGADVPVVRLRAAALEAGISAAAFDAALAAHGRPGARRRPGLAGRRRGVAAAAVLATVLAVGVTSGRRADEPPAAREATRRPVEARVASDPACAPEGVPAERLRDLARRLHPQALEPASRSRSLVVGLLFDERCALTAHAVTRRGGESLDVDTALGRLFPAAYRGAFRVAGIADAGAAHGGPGSPWIVWGVMPAAP